MSVSTKPNQTAGLQVAEQKTRDPLPSLVVTGMLACNLWLVFLVIPAPPHYPRLSLTALVIVSLPLPALIWGLYSKSGAWLLGVYPIVLVMAAVSRDFFGGIHPVSTGGLTLSALSLVGYLAISSAALEWDTRPAEDPKELKALENRFVSNVWRRRRRVYAYLLAATVVFPVTLIYALNARSAIWARMLFSYEERADAMRILVNTALCGVWIVVFFVAIRRPLHLHCRGDRPLRKEFMAYEQGKRRPIWKILFLSAMALILLGVFWFVYS